MNFLVFFVSIAHFTVDFFADIFQPLIPFFMQKYAITDQPKTLVLMASVLSMTASMSQLIIGYYTDRSSKKLILIYFFVVFSIFPGFFMGYAPNLTYLFLIFLIGYIANAAQHPLGASIAGHVGKGKSLTLAFYVLGGTFGSGLGPIVITWYVKNFGIENTWAIGLIMFVMFSILTLYAYKYLKNNEILKPSSNTASLLQVIKSLKVLYPIWILTVCRSFISSLFHMYGPIRTNSMGYDLTVGGLMLSSALISGMFSNMLGARIYERHGIKKLNVLSFSGYTVFLLMFALSKNMIFIALSFVLADIFMFFTMSANVSYAQKILPQFRGVASGALMGFAWACGNLIVMAFSSVFGNNIEFMINSLWFFAAIGIILTFILFRKKTILT
ncbi:MAG TPA: MFS transporter [Petrotogaceae bacterium]|nr:MFS transporter [Petrotogaceae bacterium]